jgi:hypothetical protein
VEEIETVHFGVYQPVIADLGRSPTGTVDRRQALAEFR